MGRLLVILLFLSLVVYLVGFTITRREELRRLREENHLFRVKAHRLDLLVKREVEAPVNTPERRDLAREVREALDTPLQDYES